MAGNSGGSVFLLAEHEGIMWTVSSATSAYTLIIALIIDSHFPIPSARASLAAAARSTLMALPYKAERELSDL